MKADFYDIESLSNVFTLCNFKPYDNCVDVYYLVDDTNLVDDPDFAKNVSQTILDRNVNFKGSVNLFDLSCEPACRHLAKTFGLCDSKMINNKRFANSYGDEFRLVCDTDEDYDEDKHPYLFGYNSYNYDTTMLACFLYECFDYDEARGVCSFTPPTARFMRDFNDLLFDNENIERMPQALTRRYDVVNHRLVGQPNFLDTRWVIRKNMLMSGRHLDVARLNEKQSKVALKRLLGMLGFQILESDKLGTGADHIDTPEQFYELVAYNVSDVVNLQELFNHKAYKASFELKRGLLHTYPDLVYVKDDSSYKPKIGSEFVRRDRLTIDSSSAQFATKALCPYGHLPDLKTVSYVYPSDRKIAELKAKGQHVKQVNVLEDTKAFFFSKFPQPELREKFMKVYNYYKSIEGKNFNNSKFYVEDYGDPAHDGKLPDWLLPMSLSDIPKGENCMPYFKADGSPSTCFVNFSTGGIHGAEFNSLMYYADWQQWRFNMALMEKVRETYPDPLDLRLARKVMIGGVEYSYTKFLTANSTIKALKATDPSVRAEMFYRDFKTCKPELFKRKSDGSYKLNDKYTFTSADVTSHEDFTSYYPNMLRMMSAFWNEGLGVDRYGEIFDNKTHFGKLMKDSSLSEAEREFYAVQRNGTKLVLNSASGAGDTDGRFGSPIQMNNRIISMRIIGQLFTYRIGQAQTFEGASITSTNTDGLYSVMEEKLNNAILARESADIGVEIEPEPMFLISKDSNNRIEMDFKTGNILTASGGSLACREDPDPTKSLAHPAILDWALCEYLVVASGGYKGLSLSSPFDREIGLNILRSARDKFDKAHLLRMYQNVLASSFGSLRFIFGFKSENEPIVLQHYNRMFIVRDSAPDSMHIAMASAKVVTDAMRKSRNRDGIRLVQHNPVAVKVLAGNNVDVSDIPKNCEASISKISNVETEWNMLVENRAINYMSDEMLDSIYERLDLDKYLLLLESSFEKNWFNPKPDSVISDEDIDFVKTCEVSPVS